jgi:hypothetical protein
MVHKLTPTMLETYKWCVPVFQKAVVDRGILERSAGLEVGS